MRNKTLPHVFLALFALGLTALLTGCSASFLPDATPTGETEIGTIQGEVHGGQSPITGAEIFLFQAGTNGYASAATSLLKAASNTAEATGTNTASDNGVFRNDYYVTTGTGGSFSISGDYTCTPGAQVYLVAYGGNPGLMPTTIFNTAIMQMAGLGQCPAAGNLAATVPYVVINEISTVVFAYAMGGFGTSATNIGSSGSALAQTGIANAMANVGNILNVGFGQSPTTTNGNPNGVVPQAKIYTLANILATCVNSSGKTNGNGQPCVPLFAATPSSSGNKPTDEATAIFNIVHNPTANVTTLFGLQPSTPVFAPSLTVHPADWTLPIVYNGVVSRPSNIAFDSSGNAWISDRTKDAVIKMTPQGKVTTITQAGVGSIYNVAVDPGDVVWAADFTNSRVYRLDTSGNVLTNITTGSLNKPTAIAFNAAGTAYVTNAGNNIISRYSASGTALAGTATYNSDLDTVYAVAVDTGGNVWTPGFGSNCGCIGELTNGNTTETEWSNINFLIEGHVEDSTAIAIDSSGTPWQANINNAVLDIETLSLLGNWVYDNDQYTSGGMNAPATLAIDGAGNFWVANSGTDTVTGLTKGGTSLYTTASGFPTGSATTAKAYAAAPDGSGNLWTANSDGTVTELLGIATPTATPVVPGQLGTTP